MALCAYVNVSTSAGILCSEASWGAIQGTPETSLLVTSQWHCSEEFRGKIHQFAPPIYAVGRRKSLKKKIAKIRVWVSTTFFRVLFLCSIQDWKKRLVEEVPASRQDGSPSEGAPRNIQL